MQLQHTIMTTLIIIGLSACGGGGDQVSASQNKPIAPEIPSTPSTPSTRPNHNLSDFGLTEQDVVNLQKFSQNAQAAKDEYKGKIAIAVSTQTDTHNRQSHTRESIAGTDKYVVTTHWGSLHLPNNTQEKIAVTNQNEDSLGRSYRYFTFSGDHFDFVQFAAASRQSGTQTTTFAPFYRAMTTPEDNVPAQGTAHYVGNAIFSPTSFNTGRPTVGTVDAHVNFAEKNMDFQISNNADYAAHFSALLIGSAFAGKSGHQSVKGVFAGDAAQEIAGEYTDTKNTTIESEANNHDKAIHASFGARKVE